ncbi:hypothetical protein [Marinomonas sp. THO17]|uniref:hypothetical protein n=1 Tax=Marinomonas sp. THO17 TaxID=3149048 RepID=UPI00336BF2C0
MTLRHSKRRFNTLIALTIFLITTSLYAKNIDLSGQIAIDGVSGAAEIYDKVGILGEQVIFKKEGVWQLGPKLPVQGSSRPNRHVSVSKRFIAVGSYSENKVWVFKRSDDDWLLMTTLTVPSGYLPGNYGGSVYIDDHLLAVADTSGQQVFLYKRSYDHWEYERQLDASDLPRGFYQSFGVTMKKVKNELYISDSSADRLFIYKNIKDQWKRTQVIEAPIELPNVDNQKFSYAFDVDRHTLAVSAYVYGQGYIQMYTRKHSNQPWVIGQRILQTDIDDQSGYFGHDVELDGSVLLVGDDYLKKIYRFDEQEDQWQLTETLLGDQSNTHFGYSFGYDNGTLLVGAKQSFLYTRPFETVTLFGRVLTDNQVPVKNAQVQGYLNHALTDQNGDYELTVQRGWSGGLQATPTITMEQEVASQIAILDRVTRDTQLNDLVFTSPYLIQQFIGLLGACIDPNMTFDGFPDDAVELEGRAVVSLTILYGWSGTLTPVSDLCTFSPTSIAVDFIDADSFFMFNTE